MRYDMTDKLNFEDNPVLVIKDTEFEINSDAETVLKIMDIVESEGEVKGAVKCSKLLFSEKEQKKLQKLNLNMNDFTTFLRVALALAVGEDPDKALEDTGE